MLSASDRLEPRIDSIHIKLRSRGKSKENGSLHVCCSETLLASAVWIDLPLFSRNDYEWSPIRCGGLDLHFEEK